MSHLPLTDGMRAQVAHAAAPWAEDDASISGAHPCRTRCGADRAPGSSAAARRGTALEGSSVRGLSGVAPHIDLTPHRQAL